MNKHIEQTLNDLRANAPRYERFERYYNGEHELAFASEKFQNTFGTLFREFALNLCPVICDAVRDKLRVTGFSEENYGDAELQSYEAATLETFTNPRDSANSINAATRSIWHRNRMLTRSGEIHKEALKTGDAYAIVWPDERGRAVIYPNRAANVTLRYDENEPGRVAWAAKAWLGADKHYRLNIFYADRIEKYISKGETEGSLPAAKEFEPVGTRAALPAERHAGWQPAFRQPNPFGVVPVFHFSNNADLGLIGRSELEAAIPVQDGLNKSVLDMLVAMEFSAYRQRWAAGIEIEMDADGKLKAPFTAGIDHLWISENANTRFGDFQAAELQQFLAVKDSFRVDIASVTGTPLHYFLPNTETFPSGEALRKGETRFIAKVRDRQSTFGQVWADLMAFALKIEGRSDASLITQWEDPSPMSEKEFLENILLKRRIGLPVEKALIEAGYGAADVGEMTLADARP